MRLNAENLDKLMGVVYSLPHPFLLGRALAIRVGRKVRRNSAEDTLEDQAQDRILPFDELPACEMCGGTKHTEQLVTTDGSRIVECDDCGLWFTSPRIDETAWMNYLMSDSERNVTFTENRFRYGVALPANVKTGLPGWRKLRVRQHERIFRLIESIRGGQKIQSLHDVGCGLGHLLEDAKNRGVAKVTGNDLNAYACKVMRERMGLEVYTGVFPPPQLKEESLDAVIMRDYIEHTYHPFQDLKNAFNYMRNNSILYVRTFHVDCSDFDALRGNWSLLFWNHVYHFSTETLTKMIQEAGFEIISVNASYHDSDIVVLARKP